MQSLETLTDLRQQIDDINNQLVELLNKRAALAQRVGKAKQGSAIYRPGREASILTSIAASNTGPLPDAALQAIFREVIGACRNLEGQLRVAYLGPEGTYSEEAAIRHCGSTSAFMPAATIDEALQLVAKDGADVAIVPIENSTEGAVSHTLDLLLELPVRICGEHTLPIRHQLLSHATSLSAITEVAGHAQALAQCRAWLDAHLPHAKRLAVSSNAEGAQRAAVRPTMAAIAGKRASGLYELPILVANIADRADNTTRFLAVSQAGAAPTGNDKTSLVCSVPNKPGTLHQLLQLFAQNGINMTKLESRPATHALWDYMFYIDIEGHAEDPLIAAALQKVEAYATFCKILGSYPKAQS